MEKYSCNFEFENKNANFTKVFFILHFSVDDASGHYTSALFYGNSFWMGSLSLCKSIYKENAANEPVIGNIRI